MNNEEKNTYVRQQITRTLIQLLEEKDISDISIKELCDTAMIGRASFYRNYSSKDNVIATYVHELISNWGEALEKNPEANILNFFEHLFNHFVENRTFYLSPQKLFFHHFLFCPWKVQQECKIRECCLQIA